MVFRRQQLLHAGSQSVLATVASEQLERLVERRQPQGQVMCEDDIVSVLEQLAIALAAGNQILLRPFPVRDIAPGHDNAGDGRVAQLVIGDRLDNAPGSVLMPNAFLGVHPNAGLPESFLEVLPPLRQIVGMEGVERRGPHGLAWMVTQDAMHRRAHVAEDSALIDDRDDVRRVFDEGLEQFLARLQLRIHPGALDGDQSDVAAYFDSGYLPLLRNTASGVVHGQRSQYGSLRGLDRRGPAGT